MSWWYRQLARPILFTQNPEEIHEHTLRGLGWLSRSDLACKAVGSLLGAPKLPVDAFGLGFPNPVGLAAGMDKHAQALPAWAALGFGFTELGAVTWHAQPGNPSPRVFRAIPEEAIVNRMGFNNPGAEAVAEELKRWRTGGLWPDHPVGMNLGKSKITPLDQAAADYANSFRVLRPYLDFFVVNVSSPNTPNLRQLQDKAALDEIFAALQEEQRKPASDDQVGSLGCDDRSLGQVGSSVPRDRVPRKPILVKVAPDLTFEALDQILELIGPREIDGIIATNTTISRPESANPDVRRVYSETGGLSGKPLRARSTQMIAHLYRRLKRRVPIIGVGGIFTAEDAWEKITAGSTLLQVYTGLVYEGPTIASSIVNGLRRIMEEQRVSCLDEAIGSKAG